MNIRSHLKYGASSNIKIINFKKGKFIKVITSHRDLRKMCPLYQNDQKNMSDPESSSSCIIDHNYNNVL